MISLGSGPIATVYLVSYLETREGNQDRMLSHLNTYTHTYLRMLWTLYVVGIRVISVASEITALFLQSGGGCVASGVVIALFLAI